MDARTLMAKLRQEAEQAQAVQMLWKQLFPEFEIPDQRQCSNWLNIDGLETTIKAIEKSAAKYNQKLQALEEIRLSGTEPSANDLFCYQWNRVDAVKYASGVMHKTAREKEGN